MDLLALAVEAYRWCVGIGLVILTMIVLKRLFRQPILDEMEEPDYMVKVHWRAR